MRKNYLLLPLFLGLLCIVSCNKELQKREQQSVPLKESTNSEIIPLNQALETLDRFLEKNYGPKTKAGKIRKIVTPWFTLITPEQIKKRMKKYGYTDVTKHSSSKFTSRMIRSTSNMLSEGKPVFLSAIPRNFTKGHSWVVDGAKFSSEDQNNYLLHFNFGWGGNCNGYFSTDCLNPAKGEEYDYQDKWDKDVRKNNYTYSWHFRLITYNIPTY